MYDGVVVDLFDSIAICEKLAVGNWFVDVWCLCGGIV
jgi:hypothetical protein